MPNPAFTILDWAVLAGYLCLLVITGVLFTRRKQKNTGDYFLGGHRMPTWAVAVSLLATVQSAATFLAVPHQSFATDLTYLSGSIGSIIAALIVAFYFLPAFYRNRVSTPYQLVGIRFGPAARTATSLMYLLGRVFASGARVFIAAIPIAMIISAHKGQPIEAMGVEIAIGIAALVLISVLYTVMGGIRSVILTDVVQASVYLGAAVVILILVYIKLDMSPGRIIEALRSAGPDNTSKLTVIRTGFTATGYDAGASFTLLTALTGLVLLNLASLGADQDNVQRLLSCKDRAAAARSLLAGVLIGIPAVALFLAIGLLLFLFYREKPAIDEKIVTRFILDHVPPGLTGLMLAGLVAASVSTINSTLNAMASTFVTDVYRHIVKDKSERHYLRIGRLSVAVAGLVLGAFALACWFWYRHEQATNPQSAMTLIDLALSVMVFAYAGLLGVFFTVLFTQRGTASSVILALIVGFAVVLALKPAIWTWLWSPWSWSMATPDNPDDSSIFRFGELQLNWTWHLVLGTLASTLVCMLPKRKHNWEKHTLVA